MVEVGCGKGFFLEMLIEHGDDVTGFDLTYDGENPRIIKKYFEPGIIITHAKGLFFRHVLERILSPYDFLCQLRDANGGGRLIYIEVPCCEWILRKCAWFDIFYEYVNYFRLNDFDRMFNRVINKGRFFLVINTCMWSLIWHRLKTQLLTNQTRLISLMTSLPD